MKSASDNEKKHEDRITTDMILDATPTMVLMLNPENKVQHVSRKMALFLGLDCAQDASGKEIFPLICDPVLLLLIKRWTQRVAEGKDVDEIVPLERRGTGRFEWISVRARAMYADGELVGKGFFLNDVTELYTQRNILDTLMLSIPGTVLVFDRDLNILFASDAAARDNGFASWREMEGTSLKSLKTIDSKIIEAMLDRLIVTDLPIHETIRIDVPESGIHWYHADLRGVKASTGSFGYILTLFDITAEIKPKAILESLMDSATEAISIVSPSGLIDYVSQSLVTMLGLDSWRSFVNRPWRDLFEKTSTDNEKLSQLLIDEKSSEWAGESNSFTLSGPDGKKVLNYRVTSLNYKKEHFGSISIATNTTALVLAREQAESAMRAKSVFLANMTHELRTPMNAILGINELLSRTTMTPLQRNYVSQVRSSATMLLSVINDILDFSRIEAKKMELIKAPYKITELIQDVVNLISVRVNEKELSFAVNLEPDIPSILIGDSVRIKQLLINLLGNAVKFTSEGEVVLSVSSTHIDDTVMLTISVRDTGMGIPKKRQEELFKEFNRIDNTTANPVEGSGLGLAISRGLVNLMGGTLNLESDTGVGSTFTAFFPQEEAEEAVPLADFPCDLPRHILIFERDKTTSNSIIIMAERAGISYTVCTDSLSFTRAVSGPDFPWTHVVFEYAAAYEDVLPLTKIYPDVRWMALLSISNFIGSGKDPSINFVFKPLLINRFDAFIHDKYVDFTTTLPMLNTLGISPQYFQASDVCVLVVDDNAINRKVAEGFLNTFDIQVDEAASGAEALEKASTKQYDLILMDHVMPEMNGVETTRRLRGQEGYENVPIIMLTANSSGEYNDEYRSAGVSDIIHKPIEFSIFVSCMRKWVTQKTIEPEDSPMQKTLFEELGTGSWIPGLDKEKALEFTGSEKNLNMILRVFARSAPKLLNGLESGHDGSDRGVYRTAAHSIISAVANVGGMKLSAKARELEQAILHGEDNDAERIYPAVYEELKKMIEDIQDYIE